MQLPALARATPAHRLTPDTEASIALRCRVLILGRVVLLALIISGCGLVMKYQPLLGVPGWSYYPHPGRCWAWQGQPIWRIAPSASGLEHEVYGCIRVVPEAPEHSAPWLCLTSIPQMFEAKPPGTAGPVMGIVNGAADRSCLPGTRSPLPRSD
jgi:hypothetical protein